MANRVASIGPATVKVYPYKSWTRWNSDVKMDDVWQLCGPTVDKHINQLPLWKTFCAVYYEGLVHGSGVTSEHVKSLEDEVRNLMAKVAELSAIVNV